MGRMKELAMEEQQRQLTFHNESHHDEAYAIDMMRKENSQMNTKIGNQIKILTGQVEEIKNDLKFIIHFIETQLINKKK